MHMIDTKEESVAICNAHHIHYCMQAISSLFAPVVTSVLIGRYCGHGSIGIDALALGDATASRSRNLRSSDRF